MVLTGQRLLAYIVMAIVITAVATLCIVTLVQGPAMPVKESRIESEPEVKTTLAITATAKSPAEIAIPFSKEEQAFLQQLHNSELKGNLAYLFHCTACRRQFLLALGKKIAPLPRLCAACQHRDLFYGYRADGLLALGATDALSYEDLWSTDDDYVINLISDFREIEIVWKTR